MNGIDQRHFRWPTNDAESYYMAQRPDLAWSRQASHYRRRTEDELVVELKFSGANRHYLVGRKRDSA